MGGVRERVQRGVGVMRRIMMQLCKHTLHMAPPQYLSDYRLSSSSLPRVPRLLLPNRTARMLFTLTMRLRKHTPRLGSFHAWNQCLNHILNLANAYIEGIVFKCFIRAAEVREGQGNGEGKSEGKG